MNQNRHDFLIEIEDRRALRTVRRILASAKYLPRPVAEMRSEWVGPHTRRERETRIIGASLAMGRTWPQRNCRFLVSLFGTGGVTLYRRLTSATDPTDYETTLDFICEHPSATVEVI